MHLGCRNDERVHSAYGAPERFAASDDPAPSVGDYSINWQNPAAESQS